MLGLNSLGVDKISIHAPAKGATYKLASNQVSNDVISIHAPAKGATNDFEIVNHYTDISIHAPAKGATYLTEANLNRALFQSTHPRRVRPSLEKVEVITEYFNPRTREGCDC